MRTSRQRSAFIASLVALSAAVVAAEDRGEPYGRVRAIEGTVALFFPDSQKRVTPEVNYPVPSGSQIQTIGGRIEMDFTPRSTLRLDSQSEATINGIEDGIGTATEIYLRKGRAELQVIDAREHEVRLDTEFGSVRPQTAALIAVARDNDVAVMDVKRGVVEVHGSGDYASMLSAPRRLILRHGTPLSAPPVTYAETGELRDDFGTWSDERRAERRLETESTPGLWHAYAAELSDAGEFVLCTESPLCFRPTEQEPSPLDGGRFVSLDGAPFWVPRQAWGWATAHYGGWIYDDGQGWLWVPGVEFQKSSARATKKPVVAADVKPAPQGLAGHPIFQYVKQKATQKPVARP